MKCVIAAAVILASVENSKPATFAGIAHVDTDGKGQESTAALYPIAVKGRLTLCSSDHVYTPTTDQEGRFRFESVQDGTYDLVGCLAVLWCTHEAKEGMLGTSNIDLEDCWNALGREMLRECNLMNHHSRFGAGEARFMWLIKHTMVASTNEFRRVVIRKGASKSKEIDLVCFAIHFYADESSSPEDHLLTIDKNMACSLSKTEERVSIRDMCRRFFDVLCASSSNRKLA